MGLSSVTWSHLLLKPSILCPLRASLTTVQIYVTAYSIKFWGLPKSPMLTPILQPQQFPNQDAVHSCTPKQNWWGAQGKEAEVVAVVPSPPCWAWTENRDLHSHLHYCIGQTPEAVKYATWNGWSGRERQVLLWMSRGMERETSLTFGLKWGKEKIQLLTRSPVEMLQQPLLARLTSQLPWTHIARKMQGWPDQRVRVAALPNTYMFFILLLTQVSDSGSNTLLLPPCLRQGLTFVFLKKSLKHLSSNFAFKGKKDQSFAF